jgi:rod shape-determining protein MreC
VHASGLPVGGQRTPRAGLWVAGFTVTSLVLLLAHATEPVQTARDAVASFLEPARQAVADVGEAVVGIGAAFGRVEQLEAENAELRADLAAADQRAIDLREAARENAELRRLLALHAIPGMELLAVGVTARDGSNFSAELVIDAGTADGVREGMAVIAGGPGGAGTLVGTVVEVGRDRARVRLVVDDRSIVIGQDQETRALGELRGQAGGGLTLVNVPVADAVEVGDAVVTAHITVEDDASRHPGGLLVGRVRAVETDVNAVTKTAYVEPAVDGTALERLMVVLDFERR